jgi:hypothetical protein
MAGETDREVIINTAHRAWKNVVLNKGSGEQATVAAITMAIDMVEEVCEASHATLLSETAELKKSLNIQKAHSALRGRILQEIRNKIGPLVISLEDEGDRIYLGSTNDKDWLTEIEETIFELDDEVWATLNREETDPYQDLYDLRVNKIPALESSIATLQSENTSLRDRVEVLEKALKFYADCWCFTTNHKRPGLEWKPKESLLDDCGNTARAALTGGDNEAAPQLLEAAKKLDDFAWSAVTADCDEATEYLMSLVIGLRAAIAKAEGRSNA